MIAFRVTSASLRLPPQGAGQNPCSRGAGRRLEDHIAE